jgi:hypothetical protein
MSQIPGVQIGGSAENEVVLRFRDGRTARAVLTSDFTPRDSAVEAETAEGELLKINISELKAAFFLKDPRRREAEMQIGSSPENQPLGAPARVEFFDAEVVHGRVHEYNVENSGFFLYPTSQESNSEKIFVVGQALHTLSLEG